MRTVTVVNRRSVPVEGMFDGAVIVWEPGEKKVLPDRVAYNIIPGSGLMMNMATGLMQVYALGIEGDPAYPCDPLDGPLASEDPVEVLNREQALEPDAAMVVSMDRNEAPVPKEESIKAGKRWTAVMTGVQEPRGPQFAGDFGDSRVIVR